MTGEAMTFEKAARIGAHLSKPYASDLFKMLVNYRDVSASEIASRLRIHVRTAQDFLEGLNELGLVEKKEVYEKKRPYFRYRLVKNQISLDLDLNQLKQEPGKRGNGKLIRERKNTNARFSPSRAKDMISSVTLWTGSGREQVERRLNLTTPQGKFLYHLPFPNAKHRSVEEIMAEAELDIDLKPEISDLVELLIENDVIEVSEG